MSILGQNNTEARTSTTGNLERQTSANENSRPHNVYWKDILSGKFVLVNFSSASGKIEYRYVCSVLKKDEDDGEVTVQGLKLMNDDGTEFSNIDESDVSNVPFENIIEILEEPKIVLRKRLLLYKFDRAVDVFEK